MTHRRLMSNLKSDLNHQSQSTSLTQLSGVWRCRLTTVCSRKVVGSNKPLEAVLMNACISRRMWGLKRSYHGTNTDVRLDHSTQLLCKSAQRNSSVIFSGNQTSATEAEASNWSFCLRATRSQWITSFGKNDERFLVSCLSDDVPLHKGIVYRAEIICIDLMSMT